MAWFVAHAILSLETIDEPREIFLVWENLHLIEAPDSDRAWILAWERAALDATAEGGEFEPDGRPTNTLDERPARWRLAGIRKLISVSHEGDDDVLRSGDELTFNEFVAESPAEVEAFARGEEVVLRRTDRG